MEKEIKYKRGKKKIQTVLAAVAFVLLCIFLQYVMMNVSMAMWTTSPVAISVLGTFLIAAVKRRQEQNFNEYGEPVNVDTDHRCNEAVRTILQALSLYAVSYCITLILWLAYKIVHMP